jgi:hypothetical protein
MNHRVGSSREPFFLFLLSLLASLELFISGGVTLLISPDPKNAIFLGLSIQRLLLVAGIWTLAACILFAGLFARRRKVSLDQAWLVNGNKVLRRTIYGISLALIVWGWLSFFCPAYLFDRLIYIFERLRPFSIAVGASLAQAWLFFLFTRGRLGFCAPARPIIKRHYRTILFFLIILIGLGAFITVTKFGLAADLIYSNVPGMPVSGLQIFLVCLLVGLWIAMAPGVERGSSIKAVLKKYQLIPISIYIVTVLVWGLTPMLRHAFSLEPGAPSYQPFPYSDARLYDLGGISIFRGYGISFFRSYDKPLYLVFLAVLHFFAGYNYTLMTWLQILVLAFGPVILYLLGRQFHSPAFGVFLSILLILRQRNAMLLSSRISSINPKLFMAEEMTLLGIILFTYLVFRWMRERKTWQAILCGGCIGVTSLFRFNSLLLFLAAACLVVPIFWQVGKKFVLKHLSAFTLAFLILLIPWVFSSITPTGKPWLLLKLRDIYNQRYSQSGQTYLDPGLRGLGMTAVALNSDLVPAKAGDGGLSPDGITTRILYHLFHNFSTSVLALPDSLIYDDLLHISQRPYWIDGGEWEGHLPPVQTGLVFLNLALLAVGLGYSWNKHRWAGMLPMVIFIAYSISLSAVMNSGGRYIVPVDWVIYFYYGLALTAILQFVCGVITSRDQDRAALPQQVDAGHPSGGKRLGFALAGIIILACLIPAANFILPAVGAASRDHVGMDAVIKSISRPNQPDERIVYGEILYLYFYEDGTLAFNFLTPQGAESYTIDRTPELEEYLQNGMNAFLALHSDKQGNSTVLAIYLRQGLEGKLIWEEKP